jgi:hypothetical protein
MAAQIRTGHWRTIRDQGILLDYEGRLKRQINIRSWNVTKAVVLKTSGASVGEFLWPIIEAKMDKYVFTELGIGCHHWVLKAIELRKSAGLVSGGEGLQDAMEKVWDMDGNMVRAATAIMPGTWE